MEEVPSLHARVEPSTKDSHSAPQHCSHARRVRLRLWPVCPWEAPRMDFTARHSHDTSTDYLAWPCSEKAKTESHERHEKDKLTQPDIVGFHSEEVSSPSTTRDGEKKWHDHMTHSPWKRRNPVGVLRGGLHEKSDFPTNTVTFPVLWLNSSSQCLHLILTISDYL